jgi:hypothetical protein
MGASRISYLVRETIQTRDGLSAQCPRHCPLARARWVDRTFARDFRQKNGRCARRATSDLQHNRCEFGVSVCCLPRGARIGAGSKGWTNRQAVELFRTSREVLDVSAFLGHPTAPHLAAFYLALTRSAVCAPPSLREPAPKCDQTKNQVQHLGSTFRAGSLQSLCRLYGRTNVRRVSRGRRKVRRGSRGGCARCLQNGRRKAASRQVSAGRGNVRYCG